LLRKAAGAVKDIFRHIDWLKVAKHAGGQAITAFTGIPTPEQLRGIYAGLETILADPAKLATKENLDVVIGNVKSTLKANDIFHRPRLPSVSPAADPAAVA
jgi:hypothetical protein